MDERRRDVLLPGDLREARGQSKW